MEVFRKYKPRNVITFIQLTEENYYVFGMKLWVGTGIPNLTVCNGQKSC